MQKLIKTVGATSVFLMMAGSVQAADGRLFDDEVDVLKGKELRRI